MVKCNMNFWKKATFKPYITFFTRITKNVMKPYTFDKQPDSTTNTGQNKYYNETNPILKLSNIVRIYRAS